MLFWLKNFSMTKKTALFLFLLFALLGGLGSARAEKNSEEFNPDYGLYFEWVYSRVAEEPERYSYIWGYGQRFGATVLAIQGEMFQPADRCVKFEGEVRACSEADFLFMEKAFQAFQQGEIIPFPDWVFTAEY